MSIPSLPKLTEVDKALAAAAGVLAQVIELGVLHGTALHYAQTASGVIAAVLVYLAHGPSKAPVVQVTPDPAPPAPPPAEA